LNAVTELKLKRQQNMERHGEAEHSWQWQLATQNKTFLKQCKVWL